MDKANKKQLKKIITWVSMAALVAGLAAMPLLAKAEAEADGPVATVHYGTVEQGTARSTLRGGGTLVTEGIEDVNLPTGVKITEFLVKNGDTVTAGTPLAAVDKVSVMTAITSVTETMEYLQEEMIAAKNEKVASTISATAGGRVKKVFARKGDSVQEVMLRDGALALLSLDGLMAVEIEKKLDILTGDTVTVTLASGKKVTGRIASNLDGVIVITIEDDSYEIGQTVTVTKDGTEIGSGELYVHNAWKASAYSGIIQSVYAKEETKISSGATLFTLTDTDFRGKLEYMSSLHREYEELMRDLFRMYNSGTIDAPCDGTISGIDKDSPYLLAAECGEPVEASLLTVEEPKWQVVLLSNEGEEPLPLAEAVCDPSLGAACPVTDLNKHVPECPKYCSGNAACNGIDQHHPQCIVFCDDTAGDCGRDPNYAHKYGCIRSCTPTTDSNKCKKEGPHYLNCIHSCTPSDGTTPCYATGAHFPGCIKSCVKADIGVDCPASQHHYPECIELCVTSESGSKTCPASKHYPGCFFAGLDYKAKVALVTQVGRTELVVSWDASNQEYEVEKIGSSWKFVSEQGFSMDLLVQKGTVAVSNPQSYKPGDVIFVVTGYRGKEAVWSGIPVYIRGAGKIDGDLNLDLDLSGLAGMLMPNIDLSALMKGFNFSFHAPSPVEEEKLFDLEGSTLMTVSPQETVSLTISLDEQDIAKVSVGQKATVKVEALSGESFQAEVTEVSNHGANSGGSSKFTAKLELPKAKDMLDGMSATASLPLIEKEDVPTIPVMALAEMGSQTVVYTALDEEGLPTNPVPVTVGLSDGITAEILEGLSVGDTYYYSYYDVLEEDTGVEERFTLT